MRKSHLFLFLAIIVLSTAVLSMAWEFWLEDVVMMDLLGWQESEPDEERWEYVLSIVAFVVLAMIYPAIMGYRLIDKERQLIAEIGRLAREDYLTGLLNRRTLTELIATEIRRCERYGDTFAVILMDVDGFKEINDTFGHATGDQLLKETGQLLQRMLRAADSAGRWGGEEFMVVCPQTGLDGASALAEKLRSSYARTAFTEDLHKTASFGVACFDPGESVKQLVARADRALYTAKRTGRNRVELSG